MADFRINVIISPNQAAAGERSVSRSLNRIERGARRVGRVLASAFAFAGISLGVGALIGLGDEFTNIQNRIRVVTETEQELVQVTEELFEVAQRTRSAFSATTELYSRVSLAARDLGISQQQVLEFTESLNQAIIISGASAQEATNGLIQLSQGLASGALRGDELRSVLEQLPVVADVIAQELGVTRGELRELGSEGKINAEIIIEAFKNAREELGERFGQTVPTLGQAFTVLRNSIVNFLGTLDEATGTTGAFAGFIIELSDNIDLLGRALTGALGPQTELTDGFKVFSTALLIGIRLVSAFATAIKTTLTTAFLGVGDTIGGVSAGIVQFFQGNFDEAGRIFDDLGSNFGDDARDSFRALINEVTDDTSQTIEAIIEIWDSSARDIQEAQANALAGGGDRTTTDPGLTDEQRKILEKQADFIQRLEDQEQDLLIQVAAIEAAQSSLGAGGTVADALEAEAQALGQAEAAQQRMRIEREAAKLGNEEFVDLVLDVVDGINAEREALRLLRQEQENAQNDAGILESLREELGLLQLTREERAVAAALQQLSTDATREQREEVAALAAQIFELQEVERAQLAFFDQFVRSAAEASRETLAGFLADPLSDGLDELPAKFARVLQDLAAQALASEIFSLLSGLGGPIGSFFGRGAGLPGFQNGGSFRVGGSGGPDSQLVAFMASPMENVTVTTPGQSVAPNVMVSPPEVNVTNVNVTDPADSVAAMETADGDRVMLNFISRKARSINQMLDGRRQ